jgi:RimJ/RimL family protein N-acetyltransferase
VVSLRDVEPADLPIFYEHQTDDVAVRMAAFGRRPPATLQAHRRRWNKILRNRAVRAQTILSQNRVAGHLLAFEMFGKPSVAYWLGRKYWGKGIATEALVQFLRTLPERPIFARVAGDNLGSIHVLRKAGFVQVGRERSFARARGVVLDDLIFRLARRRSEGRTPGRRHRAGLRARSRRGSP